MGLIAEMMEINRERGYTGANLTAKVCQDLVLRAIANSDLKRNVTIKGGVVMWEITKDVRRATQDIDIDFIRYSINNESIDRFVRKLNNSKEVTFTRVSKIEDLSQQDYRGKRFYIQVTDSEGISVKGKIDLGVHTRLDMKQKEYCFDIGRNEKAVSLLINSKEQIFVEKLKSLLKFGAISTRYKDIYDLYYLKDVVSIEDLKECISNYILNDPETREKSMDEVIERMEKTFKNTRYRDRLNRVNSNWLNA